MPLLLDYELAKGNVLFSQNILKGGDLTIQCLSKSTSSQGSLPAYNTYCTDPGRSIEGARPRVITPKALAPLPNEALACF